MQKDLEVIQDGSKDKRGWQRNKEWSPIIDGKEEEYKKKEKKVSEN